MSTNKIGLKTVEQLMNDYVPVYAPIFPLFMGKSQAYSEEVGQIDFKRIETVGDVRAKHIAPKDTEIKQIAVRDGSKSFKKYFMGNQFVISHLQSQEGVDGVHAQVLDEHNKQFDELLLTGDGTAANNVKNNGLFWSADANYLSQNSAELDNASGWLPSFHSKLIEQATLADRVAGRKLILMYGSTILPVWNSLYSSAPVPFKSVIGQVLGDNYSSTQLPDDITPSDANGFLIVNMDQIKVHYTKLPSLTKRGSNEEKEYNWFNYLMGSAMVDLIASGAIIKQPLTLEAV